MVAPTLPSWWQVTIPHKDIRDGRLGEAIFAADIGDVVEGKAPEYQDPAIFFQKTFLTTGLDNLLENVLSRLNGGKGDPVIQLQTPFGGGKTHALLALYHAVKHRDKLEHVEAISKLPMVKNAKVVVFVGTHADPIKGKTPWGEIAYQLGAYEKVKLHDEKRRAPGRKVLDEILGDDPVLILIDELVEYSVKAKDFADQISAFSQEITETVKSKEKCCLVCTLPSSAPYGEAGERVLSELQRIYGRIEAIYVPVQGVEIYEVIRKRLFEDLGDEKTRKKVAQTYFDLYQKLGTDVPSEVREVGYRERIEHAYPFHPELVDVLYERWGSYSTFQRTRGVLRLMAGVVANLYKRKAVSSLIQSSLVDLEDQLTRREFLKHIGNQYDSVIAADIAGKGANAPDIDKEMGSEYEKYGIATGIATSVFLYSFSAGPSKETTLPRIRVALLREGIPATIVGDAIAKLEEELWYFHSERKQYAFRIQPNLNRVIVDREETISDDGIQEELENLVKENAGRALEVYLWPQGSSDIPDNKNLKLAIFSPTFLHELGSGKKLTQELFEKAGVGFRVYKNTLFILQMDNNQHLLLCNALKRLLALKELEDDKSLLETLTKESQEELKKKLNEVEKEAPFKILTAYRYLAILEDGGASWKDLGIPTVGSVQTISERVKQYLKDQEKLLTRLTPKYLLDRTFGKDETEKPLREIYELHLKTPGMPLLESEKVLQDAVAEGTRAGILGVREHTEVRYREEVAPSTDSTVLRGEIAKRIKEAEVPSKEERKGIERKEIKEGLVKMVTLRAIVPWDKLSSVISGVIRPLKDKGLPPDIAVEIKAESDEGFDRITLDSKVKETLRQIGARIEKWKEE